MMRQRESFTMIELIVVVFFILLFSGTSIAYYTQYTERTKLQNASKRVVTMLSLVRQKTISGDSTMCAPQPLTTPPASVSYYSFEVNNDAESYTVRPFCSIGTPKPLTYSTEANIQFTAFITPAAPTPYPIVTFFPVNGASPCQYIYLKSTVLKNDEQCRYVKVSQSGALEEGSCSACNSCPSTCP